MDPILLKALHLTAVFGLFTSLGAIIFGANESGRKQASILHGVSLLLIVAIGFAMLKKPPMAQHWWQVKLAIWLFLGAAPALAKRNVIPRFLLLALCLAAGTYAAYLGMTKPF